MLLLAARMPSACMLRRAKASRLPQVAAAAVALFGCGTETGQQQAQPNRRRW